MLFVALFSIFLVFLSLFLSNYIKCGRNIFARLKKIKNPNTSVAVVKNTVDEIAGSSFSFFNISGINTPQTFAITRFPIIAKKIINPR